MTEKAKLLIVDDDYMMLEFNQRALESLGHPCVMAADADAALAILERDRQVRVLMSDIRLRTGMNGAQLARRARQARPDLAVILVSGDPAALQSVNWSDFRNVEFLPKPYRRRDLAERLARLT